MKKISTYLASALLMTVIFTSCSSSSDDKSEEKNGKDAKQENSNASKPEEIIVASLKEPCDYVEAIGQCLDAIIEIAEGVDSPDKLSEDDKKRIKALSKKGEEIGAKFDEKFDDEEALDCPSAGEIMIKALKLADLGIEDLI